MGPGFFMYHCMYQAIYKQYFSNYHTILYSIMQSCYCLWVNSIYFVFYIVQYQVLRQITDHLLSAQRMAEQEFGVQNLLQPGLVKEMVIAKLLGHTLRPQKDLHDAEDDWGNRFEYLSATIQRSSGDKLSCNFQIDRIRESNLYRIERNEAFYFGVFRDWIWLLQIWRVPTTHVLGLVHDKLENTSRPSCHINIPLSWVMDNGRLVFQETNQGTREEP